MHIFCDITVNLEDECEVNVRVGVKETATSADDEKQTGGSGK